MWSQSLPEWQRDALHRIAVTDELGAADRAAVRARLMHAHGISVVGDTVCLPLAQADLPAEANAGEPTILCGLGPVQHVDKLARDQELRCGVSGITLNFGDNGAGKSGFARVAKKPSLPRLPHSPQRSPFPEQPPPP